MSWLLFLDVSWHDHRNMPYEVRCGVALHAGKLWSFVQDLQRLELSCFGTPLAQFRKEKELKGYKLLDKDRFKWASQNDPMPDETRRKHCRGFLTKGLEKKPPTRDEFTAYGQACLEMARSMFQSLRDHEAALFAAIIPCDVKKPETHEAEEFLRKDHVFLLERFFYFLEGKGSTVCLSWTRRIKPRIAGSSGDLKATSKRPSRAATVPNGSFRRRSSCLPT